MTNDNRASTLMVARDRACVRELILQAPSQNIVSASALFDKVRSLVFLYQPELVRDDYAPTLIAQDLLARNESYPVTYARKLASLYSSLFHGVMNPDQVYHQVSKASAKFAPIIELVHRINGRMNEKKLVNGVSALFYSWQIIKDKKVLPPPLARFHKISLHHLVDLTSLEIETIKSLADLGLPIDIIFPLDFHKRSLNVAVNYAASLFENEHEQKNIDLVFESIAKEGPLKELSRTLFSDDEHVAFAQENCQIITATSLEQEGHIIAQKMAGLKEADSKCRIAFAVPSIDRRSKIYKSIIGRYGLTIKDRKGVPLSETSAGILLKTLASCRLNHLPKKDLLGLYHHAFFKKRLATDEERSEIIGLIDKLSIDDRVFLSEQKICRYQNNLERFLAINRDREDIILPGQKLAAMLCDINELLARIEDQDNLGSYLKVIRDIIDETFVTDNIEVQALVRGIDKILGSANEHSFTHKLSCHQFFDFLEGELSLETLAPPDEKDVDAIELLLVPELLGRSFDHVFIADIAFGRLPKNMSTDSLMRDEDRIELNKIVNQQVLRVFFDDPFEPLLVPPRQSLEPFWFASAVSSAEKSIHFSYASHDDRGSEQAPSEFFLWLQNHVSVIDKGSEGQRFAAGEDIEFHRGKYFAQTGGDNIYLAALAERKHSFAHEGPAPWAFSFNKSDCLKIFKGRLGEKPLRPLTPTMVEAFSSCSFYGLLNRLLKIEPEFTDTDDTDVRVIGQVAHHVLEKFYSSKNNLSIDSLVKQAGDDYLAKNYLANPEVFFCHLDWLGLAIKKLTTRLNNHPQYRAQNPLALELPFGIKGRGQKALRLSDGEIEYLVGGIIDRIDKRGSEIIVTDYKVSALSSLNAQASPRAFMKSNFQAPIYLRLAASFFNETKNLSFNYVSIRDGMVKEVFSPTKNTDLTERIFNNHHNDGLLKNLDVIFAPIAKGEVVAKKGEQCAFCDYAMICRKSEVQS